MNELQLSKDLNVITAEIQSYKQIAGQSIFEIGRRLKHVKENDLVHGEFGKWLESIDFNQSQASRFIKVYEELGDTNLLTSANVGFRNLLEIATLPEEARDKEHVTSKGETKTVDEMTVRELQELKRKLKEKEAEANQYHDWYDNASKLKDEAEKQAEQARRSEEIARKQLEESEDKKPQVIEKEIVKEVVPKRINEEIEQLKNMVKSSNEAYKQAERELQNYRLKEVNSFDEEQAEQELKKLRFEAEKGVLRLTVKVNKFLEEIAPYGYMEGEIATSSKSTKEQLEVSLEHLKNFIRKMETSLKGRIEI